MKLKYRVIPLFIVAKKNNQCSSIWPDAAVSEKLNIIFMGLSLQLFSDTDEVHVQH